MHWEWCRKLVSLLVNAFLHKCINEPVPSKRYKLARAPLKGLRILVASWQGVKVFMRKTKTLIRLCRCAGLFESSLYAHGHRLK